MSLNFTKNMRLYVTFQVLVAVTLKMRAFWDIAPCLLFRVDILEVHTAVITMLMEVLCTSETCVYSLQGAIYQKSLIFMRLHVTYLKYLVLLIAKEDVAAPCQTANMKLLAKSHIDMLVTKSTLKSYLFSLAKIYSHSTKKAATMPIICPAS
jgi:hypothetical protein